MGRSVSGVAQWGRLGLSSRRVRRVEASHPQGFCRDTEGGACWSQHWRFPSHQKEQMSKEWRLHPETRRAKVRKSPKPAVMSKKSSDSLTICGICGPDSRYLCLRTFNILIHLFNKFNIWEKSKNKTTKHLDFLSVSLRAPSSLLSLARITSLSPLHCLRLLGFLWFLLVCSAMVRMLWDFAWIRFHYNWLIWKELTYSHAFI